MALNSGLHSMTSNATASVQSSMPGGSAVSLADWIQLDMLAYYSAEVKLYLLQLQGLTMSMSHIERSEVRHLFSNTGSWWPGQDPERGSVGVTSIYVLEAGLVELIVGYGWDCLSATNYRHGYAMTQWMLVSHEWLKIVVPIVFRDVWITSVPHMRYISTITNASYICQLAGIDNPRKYIMENCRSLTVSAYQKRPGEYAAQCAELEEYARNPNCTLLIADFLPARQRVPAWGIPPRFLATFIRDYVPFITSLHFVLVDCTPVYYNWQMRTVTPYLQTDQYPPQLADLHITFAYTTPPPRLLRDAPRGTFFPPRSESDLPPLHNFPGVRRLVVRDVHADFIAFITNACPVLECIESTAEFGAEDLPPHISDKLREQFVFRRLAPTTFWGLPAPTPAAPATAAPALTATSPAGDSPPGAPKKKHSFWRIVRHAFRKRS
ncbi:hypothetical protein FB45DRAFT_867467 [Roridomyces roridus]|uniref:Uncharacterized protein n=1 Tax=Roridomyces roridus TaxID=1738132 RepID=A0AAD7FM63_9AGAR|nr:hypothetical protein FB45DRAFT_867467 [Roridomyces roridus]